MKSVLLIGLHPSVVDFSLAPGLTEETLAQGLASQEQSLRDLGFDAEWSLLDRGETALDVLGAALDRKRWDVVLIGAGLRQMTPHFILFERLLNLVHERAPGAKICFNTKPTDTREAVLRWASP